MAVTNENVRVRPSDLAEKIGPSGVALKKFKYYVTGMQLAEDDEKEYLHEPIGALPPVVLGLLPELYLALVPYLEHENGKNGKGAEDAILLDQPSERNGVSSLRYHAKSGPEMLAFAIRDQEMADYHYHFYRSIAEIVADNLPKEPAAAYAALLKDELNAQVHGEVDEKSWHLKQQLTRKAKRVRGATKGFLAYSRESFIDTSTLYLHGICCDIDVETGPRQVPSRYLRKRLLFLQNLFPPPPGYAVFPEDLKEAREDRPHAPVADAG